MKKSKENYELALLDITNYNSRYQVILKPKHVLPKLQEDMTDVFERCQRKEAQRLQTIKDTMFSIHKCLNIAEDPTYVQNHHHFVIHKQKMTKQKKVYGSGLIQGHCKRVSLILSRLAP